MKRNKFLTLAGISLFLLSSCDSDFESVPIEQFTIDAVFSTTDSLGNNAKYYLNEIYALMTNGHNRVNLDYLDAATDDAVSSSLDESDAYKLSIGRYSAGSIISSEMRWATYYTGIRKVNTFIAYIDRVPFMEKVKGKRLNQALKAEARFLRSHFYFELVKRYGGVSLIGDKIFQLNDDLELPRNTFEDCVNYIVTELDAIKDSLRTYPIESPSANSHVVTKEAAMAFRSRVLLYAASPLFNESPIDPGNLLVGYTQYDEKRWEKAAEAAKWFIDTYNKNTSGGSTFALTPDFRDVFLSYYDKTNNPEVIFFQQGDKGRGLEYRNGPVGFSANGTGLGQTSPTQNLVDAFLMLDGKPRGESTEYTYDYSNMYKNRDPRLDMTVLHNESPWLSTTLATYDGGSHNPSSAIQKTKTSYYMRKFMGKFENQKEYPDDTYHIWVMYRYAEILLNYAEAQNEYAGPTEEVYQTIIELRKRAKIKAGDDNLYGLKAKADMTKSEMRKLIQNERRLELAFEEHRYWDIRRWKIAEEVFSKAIQGLTIVKDGGSLSYNPITVLSTSFDPKRYLYPIPYSEVIKNKNMIQNPKW